MKLHILPMSAPVLVASLLAGVPFTLSAQGSIVIGTRDGKDMRPFGILSTGTTGTNAFAGRYQQIYIGTAFPGPVSLSGVAFSQINPGTLAAHYDLSLGLGITARGLNNATPVLESGAVTVFAGSLSPVFTPSTGDFDLAIQFAAPFHYDPSQGNLLLEVMMVSGSGNNVGFALDSSGSSMVSLWESGGGVVARPYWGLVTEFSVIPEPASFALFVLGGLLVAASPRERRRSRG